jgi:hypothetical protein
VPVVAFSGPSGAGKTTLLVALLRELRRRGLRVAAIKHSGHPHGFDVPGKDSDLLLRAGAEVAARDRYGVTPLSIAALNGNAAMIGRLLDAGADPNTTDPTGETALMTAARVGVLPALGVLLERGARVDAREPQFEQTALIDRKSVV